MEDPHITILGVGNILFRDEGVGVRVVETLEEKYRFSDKVHLVDGGVLGLSLMGVICQTDVLIVIDAVRNGGKPGDLYRLEGEQVPQRILAKNSLHQVDLLETLTSCRVLGKVPETVILGVEPLDIETLGTELTGPVQEKVPPLCKRVLKELDRFDTHYALKEP